MASRRKRGPLALRPQLSLGLPLSDVTALVRLSSNRVNSENYVNWTWSWFRRKEKPMTGKDQ